MEVAEAVLQPVGLGLGAFGASCELSNLALQCCNLGYFLRLQVSRDRESWALEFQSWSWRVQSWSRESRAVVSRGSRGSRESFPSRESFLSGASFPRSAKSFPSRES